jgi:hypothetical protein
MLQSLTIRRDPFVQYIWNTQFYLRRNCDKGKQVLPLLFNHNHKLEFSGKRFDFSTGERKDECAVYSPLSVARNTHPTVKNVTPKISTAPFPNWTQESSKLRPTRVQTHFKPLPIGPNAFTGAPINPP